MSELSTLDTPQVLTAVVAIVHGYVTPVSITCEQDKHIIFTLPQHVESYTKRISASTAIASSNDFERCHCCICISAILYAHENEKELCLFITCQSSRLVTYWLNLFMQFYNAKHCDTCHNRHKGSLVSKSDRDHNVMSKLFLLLMFYVLLLLVTMHAIQHMAFSNYITFICKYAHTSVFSSFMIWLSLHFHILCKSCTLLFLISDSCI